MKLTIKYKNKELITPVIEEIRTLVRMNNKINLLIIVEH